MFVSIFVVEFPWLKLSAKTRSLTLTFRNLEITLAFKKAHSLVNLAYHQTALVGPKEEQKGWWPNISTSQF